MSPLHIPGCGDSSDMLLHLSLVRALVSWPPPVPPPAPPPPPPPGRSSSSKGSVATQATTVAWHGAAARGTQPCRRLAESVLPKLQRCPTAFLVPLSQPNLRPRQRGTQIPSSAPIQIAILDQAQCPGRRREEKGKEPWRRGRLRPWRRTTAATSWSLGQARVAAARSLCLLPNLLQTERRSV